MLLNWLTAPLGTFSEAKIADELRTQVESLTAECSDVRTKAAELRVEKEWLKAQNAALQREMEALRKQNKARKDENENLRETLKLPRTSVVFRWRAAQPPEDPK
jgi:outer membrane murein-binding lipoprotein Lpp